MIKTSNYVDFKAIASGLGVTPYVFYFDGGSAFQAIAVGQPTVVEVTLSSAKPGSFSTDYPSAISLTGFVGA